MSFLGGSTTTESRAVLPEPSPEEEALLGINLDLARRQLFELSRLTEQFQALQPAILRDFGITATPTGPAPATAPTAPTTGRRLQTEAEQLATAPLTLDQALFDPGFINSPFAAGLDLQSARGLGKETSTITAARAEAERALASFNAERQTTVASRQQLQEQGLLDASGRQAALQFEEAPGAIRTRELRQQLQEQGLLEAIGPEGEADPGGELLRQVLGDIRGAKGPTEAERALVSDIFGNLLGEGEADIERFQTQALEKVREVLAPSRGLRPSDTPITDRGFEIGGEAARQQGQLVRALAAALSGQLLDLPFRRNQLALSAAGPADELAARASEFSKSLRQRQQEFQLGLGEQAQRNRLDLFSTLGTIGLGLATGGTNPAQLLSTLRNARLGAAGQNTTVGSSPGLLDIAGGVGAVAAGFG